MPASFRVEVRERPGASRAFLTENTGSQFHPQVMLEVMKNHLRPSGLAGIVLLLLGVGTNTHATVGATTPFISYEAEAGTCGGGAVVVSLTSPPTTQYSSPQLEASGHAYVQLAGTGQYVQWTNNTGQNITAINVRECIPDAPTGGGMTATLDFYVDGVFRQALNLNSMQTWLYENSTNYNGNDQDPTHGSPRVFFDEVHTFITGAAVAPGSIIRLQQDSTNNAAFYYIDVIDLESPPAALSQPANSLSITTYGAVANNISVDSTTAIQNCINAAQSQGKSVWIPPGTYYLNTTKGLTATGITIQGAGTWYSTIYRNVPIPNPTPLAAIFSVTSCTVRNFALDANATSRASVDGCGGAMDTSGTNWLADSIWTQHTMSGFWASGVGGTVQNCRLTSIWADGINLNNVSLNNTVGNNLTNRNNFVRGTGDDANAINSVNYNGSQYYTPMSGIVIMNTTAIAPWGGKGVAIYGGSGHLVMNNFMSDTARYVGLGVMKFGVNGSDLLSATVIGNTVLRCGGNGYLQQQQAMMIGNGGDGQAVGMVANAYCASNTIINSLYDAVGFSSSTNIVFQYNTILAPGLDGIAIGPPSLGSGVMGAAIINSNTVSGLKTGQVAFTNSAAAYAAIMPMAATGYTSVSGAAPEPCAEGGQELGSIAPGDWSAYSNVNLNGANAFVARAASASSGNNIEIHLDTTNGPLIGTCVIPGTGGGQSYTNAYCALTGASGIHNVYLIATGSGGGQFALEFFGFFTAPPVASHQLAVGTTVSLRALANNKYVCADNGGTNALIAKSTSIGPWERFTVVDAGGGNIGLQAANSLYVCAENAGASPLIANRTGVGSWESFFEVDAGGGNIGLRALINGEYVSADNGGANPLIANSNAVGTWQSFTVVTPPAVPSGLMAIASYSQVALSWAGSAGATGYNLKRSTTNGGPYAVIAANLPSAGYTDTGLTNFTAYYYVVSATNDAGESTNSLQVSATPGLLTRAGWVASAISTESGGSPANALDGDITTRWSTGAPQTNGQWFQVDMGATNTFYRLVLDAGSSSSDYPRGYRVNVSNDGANWGSPVATGAGSSAVTTITFATNTARYIRVTQTGSVSGLWWSIHEFNVYGTSGTPPATPTGLSAVAGDGRVALAWNPTPKTTGYNVRRATALNGTYSLVATNLAGVVFTNAGLANGSVYYFTVSAINLAGESSGSAPVSAQPVSMTPPQLVFQPAGGQMQLAWPQDHTSWSLQVQTNSPSGGLGTNWVTVPASKATNQMTFPLDSTSGSVFFRLIYP
jgi:fibronectin type 3 domain-containing protein